MELSCEPSEHGRIITASNSNQKLSFQGWDKCVEAFSQGKGTLSHHCTRILSHLDSSQPDEVISWSSSEGECDEASIHQQAKPRPIRTLASRINFDDCKQTHKRGRRHTSAQFVRLIERRSDQSMQSCSEEVFSDDPVNHTKSIVDGSTPESNNCSESFEELLSMKNMSFLNKRIGSESLNTTDQSVVVNENINETVLEKLNGSPIFAPSYSTVQKKTSKSSPSKSKSVGTESTCDTLDLPTSPIFKTNSYKKRRRQKISEDSSKQSGRQSLEVKTLITCSDSGTKELSEHYLSSAGAEEQSTLLSPKNSRKNVMDVAVSPIIGKSNRKRSSKMKIDVPISPILGSVNKQYHKGKKTIQNFPKVVPDAGGLLGESEGTNTLLDCDPFLLSNPNLLGANSEANDLFNLQSKTCAKRSLDFSLRNKVVKLKENELKDTPILPLKSYDNSCSQSLSNQSNLSAHHELDVLAKEVTQEDVQGLSTSLSFSHLIEEINTEQCDFDNIQAKPMTTPSLLSKKKKLSLNKKMTLKRIDSRDRVENSRISFSKVNKLQDLTPTSEKKLTQQSCKSRGQMKEEIYSICKENKLCMPRVSECNMRSPNNTLFIEEAFSEPLESSFHTFVSPPIPMVENIMPRKGLIPVAMNSDKDTMKQRSKKDCETEVIDDFSSPSVVDSQRIERLPSPVMSSPFSISQTSSPPAPDLPELPIEKSDSFNAPPRKGRKKLKPDGLANRLQRLLNRQRSSSRIWQFKRSKYSTSTSVSSHDHTTSVLLMVNHTWTEYSHVIVQGYIQNDYSETYLKALSNSVVLVLDPNVAERLGRIMIASKIRIFPPWQALKLRGASVILCANCIEVIDQIGSQILKRKEECPFLIKEGFENVQGINLLDIILPKSQECESRLVQFSELNANEDSNDCENLVNIGTVSNIVSSHCVGKSASDLLILTILQAFRYRQPAKDGTFGDHPIWSLLGQDVSGELCEVVIGCEDISSSKMKIWQDLRTREVFGKLYNFCGFSPMQRISPFRVSSLWSVISSISQLEKCDQSVFYVLAPTSSTWECEPSENKIKHNSYLPKFSSLRIIASESNNGKSQRYNVLCRLLHSTNERLYITDVETSPTVTVVSVNSTAYVPSIPAKEVVLSILNLETLSVGELRADKYTRIQCIDMSNTSSYYSCDKELFKCLSSLKPVLPSLHEKTPAKSLTMFSGLIVGIDEDSAFMWPACANCGNELLSVGANGERYNCEKCPGQSENFSLRMSLQILATCSALPEGSTVRVKLLQSTIETLLPPSLCSEEGYDMNTVIGRKLGPLKCVVQYVKGLNFVLQELP